MFGKRLLGRTHVPHHKNTADVPATLILPEEVLLPTLQHIGAPAVPTVKVGDRVRIGDLVASAEAPISSAVYASVSGTVKAIENYLRPSGAKAQLIRIESDGLMERAEVTPPVVTDLDSLVLAARAAGLVGLGGAGFPTDIKLAAAKRGNIHTVIINAAECEPYITSDTRAIMENGDTIEEGVLTLMRLISSIGRVIIGIERNKPAAIRLLDRIFDGEDRVKVKALPSLYPQGAEKIIVYNTTGITVGEGKLPTDAGVLVMNVSTLIELMNFIHTGMPLTERTLTVDGPAIESPKNVRVPIGTPIYTVLAAVGANPETTGKVLYGGPMMGVAVANDGEPVLKTTNALTVMRSSDSEFIDATPCIHCGRCVSACPMRLNPTAFTKAMELDGKEDRIARLEDYKVELCIDCGCCSFVCPANRPLVQNNRMAKAEVREYRAHLANLNK